MSKTYRNVGKEMISQVGRKLISGTFNLTTVSFPIKSMIYKSSVESTLLRSKYIINN